MDSVASGTEAVYYIIDTVCCVPGQVFGTAVSLVVCILLLDELGAELSGAARGRRHYCGRDLATALSVLCDGWYKRSSANAMGIACCITMHYPFIMCY